MERFAKTQKLADTIKSFDRHLENASQINQKMESLWIKIEDVDRWIIIENNSPSGILGIKD